MDFGFLLTAICLQDTGPVLNERPCWRYVKIIKKLPLPEILFYQFSLIKFNEFEISNLHEMNVDYEEKGCDNTILFV